MNMNSIQKRSSNNDHDPFQESILERQSILRNIQSIFRIIHQVPTGGNSQFLMKASLMMTSFNENSSNNGTSNSNINSNSNLIIRSLKPNEIQTLVTECQCQSDNWSTVFIMYSDGNDDNMNDNMSMNMNMNTNMDNERNLILEIKKQIKNCSFQGHVVLGLVLDSDLENHTTSTSTTTASTLVQTLKPAIRNTTVIKDSIISPGARVYNNTMISNSFIGPNSSIINCGSVYHQNKNGINYEIDNANADTANCFTDDMEITLGPESGGGRPVNIKPESTLVDICYDLGIKSTSMDEQMVMKKSDATSISTLRSKTIPILFNVIMGHLQFNQMITNVYISESAIVQSCPSIVNTILLPQSNIQNSTIKSTFLQWNASIVDSNVSSTILMECSAIGPNSIVASTVLGPDSHVSCGEVHCSLIGPNTNSHHQSLVISVLWPMGRGNVGYGSNIGSNHTGRLPDQECTAGEGVFWGLGCVIKFPVDLSRSYYSIVAAGVQLPPQSVSMPFSLIMSGSSNDDTSIAKGKNEIVPGWLLQSSPYTVLRSEEKFKKRRKAKRHGFYCGWRIIRPSIVDACCYARASLLKLDNSRVVTSGQGTSDIDNTQSDLYTNSTLTDLGDNYMTKRGRKVGIGAYTIMIQRYALQGLYDKMNDIMKEANSSDQAIQQICTLFSNTNHDHRNISLPTTKSWPIMPWEEESHNDMKKVMNHQLSVLSSELRFIIGSQSGAPMTQTKVLVILLQKMIDLEIDFFKRVKKSKMRDDWRGSDVIPNYNDAHVLAADDPVVKMAEESTNELVSKCKHIISRVESFEARGLTNTPQSKL